MPTVLEYNPQGRSSPTAGPARSIGGPEPLKQANPVESFGVAPVNPTAIGNATSDLGQGISKFAASMQAMQQRVNTTAAEEQLVKFSKAKNDLFFNPESGYFNTRGRQAYDEAKPFTQQIEELQRVYSDELSNTEARNMFVRASDSQVVSARSDVMRHASTQFDAWERATIGSRIEDATENGALYWNDPDKLAINLELGRQSVMDLGQLNGASPETMAEDLQTFHSKFAVASIEGALSQSASAAQVALANSKELLEGPDIVKIQKQIDSKFKVEKSQIDSQSAVNFATATVEEFADQPNARQMILDRANQIEDPELRQKTIRESMYQYTQRSQATNERKAASFEAAENFVVTGGSVEQFIAQNPSAWDDLTAGQKNRIMSGSAVSTDFNTLSNLLLLPTDKLAKVDPAVHFHKLSPGDRQRLISAVKSAKEGTGESQVGRTRAAQVTTTVERFFGKRTSWNNNSRKQADAFYATLTAEEERRVEQKGSPLTSEEFTGLINDMSREVSINRSNWVPGSTTLDITSIPSEELGPLTEYLHQNDIPATADNLIRAYEQASQ